MLSTGEFLYVYSWKWEARASPDIWIRFHVEPNLGSRVEYVQHTLTGDVRAKRFDRIPWYPTYCFGGISTTKLGRCSS